MSKTFVKKFEMTDQENFARVSGDFNPLHMDPLVARRTAIGLPVVHGMNVVLAGLEAWIAGEPVITHITAQFMKPIYVGDEVRYTWTATPGWRCVADVGGAKVMILELKTGVLGTPSKVLPMNAVDPVPGKARELSFSQIQPGLSGHLGLALTAPRLFPDLAKGLGDVSVAFLTSLSTLVGMECPGFYSIFTGFQIAFDPAQKSDRLNYVVQSTDDRFFRIRLGVEGGPWKGTVDAACRKPPVEQPSVTEIARQVPGGRFKGQRVLVIGGSRGIGEYTAKMAAAGGAEVILTYLSGSLDARRVQQEIEAFGGKAWVLPYDARSPASGQLQNLPWVPTHVYYYATGRIFGKRGKEFDPALLDEFRHFYVEGFRDLCMALYTLSKTFSVFYPSSVAVLPEERPKALVEYAMAKEEGEALCVELEQRLPGLRITQRRLPRLPTDQTATARSVGEKPMEDILPWLMEFQNPA